MRRQEAAERKESGPEIKFWMRWIFSPFFQAARHGDIQDFLHSPSVVLSNITVEDEEVGTTWPS